MKQYSDSTVSDFLNSVTDDQSIGFLNSWNETRNHREKIYISYDSTNKNCQAGDIEMVEFGHPKVDVGQPVFNYAVAYDTHNQEPLFYEKYPGSLNDISQLQFMLDKAFGYGYKKIGFILDRGYFSCENIQYIDKCGYSFVIMVKGMASLVNELVLEHKGTFESKRVNNIYEYGVYGKTVKHRLYAGYKKERYFHLYHSCLLYTSISSIGFITKDLRGQARDIQHRILTGFAKMRRFQVLCVEAIRSFARMSSDLMMATMQIMSA